jgi:hypothetical protein
MKNVILSKPIIIYIDNTTLSNMNILVFNNKTNYAIKIIAHVANTTIENINLLSISSNQMTPQELMVNPYNLDWLTKYDFDYEEIKVAKKLMIK